MKDVCSAATSRCAPIFAKYATCLELHSPTFPVCVSAVEVRNSSGVPCVQNVTCCSCHAAMGLLPDSLQPLDHEVLPFTRATEEDESTIKTGDATECVFWHSYALMTGQDETVSTLVCMCHYISLHVFKTQRKTSFGESNYENAMVMVRAVTVRCTIRVKKTTLFPRKTAKNGTGFFLEFILKHTRTVLAL